MLSRSRLSLSKNIQSCHLTGQPQMQFPKEGNLGYSHTLGGLMAAHTKTCCGHRIFHITILESSRSHPRQYSILYLIKTLHQSTPTQPAHFWHNPTTATALYQATKQHLNKLYSEKTWKMRWKAKPLISFWLSLAWSMHTLTDTKINVVGTVTPCIPMYTHWPRP